eukprot:CAMPEP_0184007222 /NCGR_PEP_ID=MMETSP0954-20121128/1189_1 /TAXON_ID=627963 /ORGANISM="Aplanochytrium sp, Strain PBS07" /LENGTH=151 /DNA_ID=CAMNT_0026285979 /DNA_START=188 /DNA_END=643 /DNA_ORIENTATION=+
MHGIKMDKRENLIEEAQEFLTAELMDIDGIDIEASKDDVEFMLLCARKVDNDKNSPASLKELLHEIIIGGEEIIENKGNPKDVDDFLDLLGMMEQWCLFLAGCPQNQAATKAEYNELQKKATDEKNRLEYEQYMAMGGEGTLEEYLADMEK